MPSTDNNMIIYHHLGLGDHFMCHGIVRHYAREGYDIITFAKPHYHDTVSYMYRDLDNVTILSMDDREVLQYIHNSPISNVVYSGYKHPLWETEIYSGKNFDYIFYHNAELDLSHKWDDFYIERDEELEMTLFNRFKDNYGITEGEYVFIHDTSDRAYTEFGRGPTGDAIDTNYVNHKDLPIVTPENVKFNMCEYMYLLEHAKEIHVVNSSFYNLIELINTNGELYYHEYIRGGGVSMRKDWNIIKEPFNG